MADNAVNAAYDSLGIQRGGGRSTTFYEMGKTTMTSLAQGIIDEGGTVADALRTTMQNAVDKMDLSGITEKINKKLGEAFSG